MTSSNRSEFQPGWIHYAIFGLSAILIGMHSVQILPLFLKQTALQTGIIGVVAFLGFVNAGVKRCTRINESRTTARVESRLDRQLDCLHDLDMIPEIDGLLSSESDDENLQETLDENAITSSC